MNNTKATPAQIKTAGSDSNVDWFIFITSAVLILAVCVPLILYPDSGYGNYQRAVAHCLDGADCGAV